MSKCSLLTRALVFGLAIATASLVPTAWSYTSADCRRIVCETGICHCLGPNSFAQRIFYAEELSEHVAASAFPPALVEADDIPRRGHLRWDFARSCLYTA